MFDLQDIPEHRWGDREFALGGTAGFGIAARRPRHGEPEARPACADRTSQAVSGMAPVSAGATLLQDVDRLRDAALARLVGLGTLDLQPGAVTVA